MQMLFCAMLIYLQLPILLMAILICCFIGLHCSELPDIANIEVTTTGTGYLDTVSYTCFPGYLHLTGDLTRTCVAPGQWTGSLPACEGNNTKNTT